MNKAELNDIRKDIAVICDYLAYDEKRHFEESNRPRKHIWRHVKRVQRWLENNEK